MLALILCTLAHAGSLGVTGGVAAWRGTIQHVSAPTLGLSVMVDQPGWAVVGEAAWTGLSDHASGHDWRHDLVRADVIGALRVGRAAAKVHLGLGPALTVRHTALTADETTSVWRAQPGLRARTGIDVPIGAAWLGWHAGLTTRGPGLDLDTALSGGWRW